MQFPLFLPGRLWNKDWSSRGSFLFRLRVRGVLVGRLDGVCVGQVIDAVQVGVQILQQLKYGSIRQFFHPILYFLSRSSTYVCQGECLELRKTEGSVVQTLVRAETIL